MPKFLREELYKIMDLNSTDSPQYLVAKEILKSLNGGVKLNSSQIADNAFISKPTVTRFAQSLGFEGFKDFEKELMDQEALYYFDVNPQLSHEAFLAYRHVLQRIIKSVEIEEPTLIEVSQKIQQKKRIFIFSTPDNFYLATSFAEQLSYLGIEVICALTNQFLLVNSLQADDLALFLVSGRETQLIARIWNTLDDSVTTFLLASPIHLTKFKNPNYVFSLNIDRNLMHVQLKNFLVQYLLDQVYNLVAATNTTFINRLVNPKHRF